MITMASTLGTPVCQEVEPRQLGHSARHPHLNDAADVLIRAVYYEFFFLLRFYTASCQSVPSIGIACFPRHCSPLQTPAAPLQTPAAV